PAGLDEYRAMLRALGIARAVVVQPGIYRDNRATLDALASAGGLWRGVARIDDGCTDAELRRLHEAGFRGVRLDGRKGPEGLAALEAMAARIAPLGWHVQLHLYARDLPELASRLAALPVDVVLDHFARVDLPEGTGQPGFRAVLELLATRRCWVKLSAPYRFGEPKPPYAGLLPFAKALVAAAPDRLVWGSDWPHASHDGFMPNDGDLLDLLTEWVPDATTRTMILATNPARLYDFASPEQHKEVP
ncbi:MAG: amidohydrolase family protein, partial [Acidisphaera sp.]|nr:amidohydrolase family protein [Acidisphaera sp.]